MSFSIFRAILHPALAVSYQIDNSTLAEKYVFITFSAFNNFNDFVMVNSAKMCICWTPVWGAIWMCPLIRPCQTNVNSDQTIPDQSVYLSDRSALKTPFALGVQSLPLIRPCQTERASDQIKMRPLSRQLFAQIYFWSDYCALESNPWSDYCALDFVCDQSMFFAMNELP